MSESKHEQNRRNNEGDAGNNRLASHKPEHAKQGISSKTTPENEAVLAEQAQINIAVFKEALKVAGENESIAPESLAERRLEESNATDNPDNESTSEAESIGSETEVTHKSPPGSYDDTVNIQTDTVNEYTSDSALLPLPEKLGKFQLIRPLGEGGFGRVFLGLDPDLERYVAIKVPKPAALISDDSRRRLGIEARATSILTHPNIVPVYASASHGPFQFLVSAYCPGPTLADWLQQQNAPIDLRDSIEMTRCVALAIHHAHQRNIIHRDIKPGNLILEIDLLENDEVIKLANNAIANECSISSSDLSSRVRVTDFGLARILQEVDRSLTQEGAIVGTPNYLAPEQVNGTAGLSPATDIYSLGVVLFEMLCGRVPFDRESVTATLNAVVHELPASPRSLRKSIDTDLEAICLKCLEKQPVDRYQSMADLANDLDNWLSGLPTLARPATRLQRCQKWIYRNPIVTLLGIALAIVSAFSMFGYFDAIHHRRIAETESERANRQKSMAQTAINKLAADVARTDSLPRDVRLPLIRQADQLQQALLKENPNDLEILFETQKTRLNWSMLLYEAGDLKLCESFLVDGMEKLTGYRDDPAIELLRSSYAAHLIKVYRTSGNLDAALNLAETEFNNGSNSAPTQHKFLSTRANTLADQGRYLEAAASAEQALVLLLSEPEQTPSIRGYYISSLRILAVIEMDQQNYRIARVTLEEALELANQLASEMPYHQSMMIEGFLILVHLSECQFLLGNFNDAAEKLDIADSVIHEVVEVDASNDHLIKFLGKLYRVRILEGIIESDFLSVHSYLDKFDGLLSHQDASEKYVQSVTLDVAVSVKKLVEQLPSESLNDDGQGAELLQHAMAVLLTAEDLVDNRLADNETFRRKFENHSQRIQQILSN